jgi:hypothetical protein
MNLYRIRGQLRIICNIYIPPNLQGTLYVAPSCHPPFPLNVARLDLPVRRVRLQSLSPLLLLFLAHISTTENGPRNVCWPRIPCANDDGPPPRSSETGRQSRGTTSHPGYISLGDRSASRQYYGLVQGITTETKADPGHTERCRVSLTKMRGYLVSALPVPVAQEPLGP